MGQGESLLLRLCGFLVVWCEMVTLALLGIVAFVIACIVYCCFDRLMPFFFVLLSATRLKRWSRSVNKWLLYKVDVMAVFVNCSLLQLLLLCAWALSFAGHGMAIGEDPDFPPQRGNKLKEQQIVHSVLHRESSKCLAPAGSTFIVTQLASHHFSATSIPSLHNQCSHSLCQPVSTFASSSAVGAAAMTYV